MWFFPHRLFLIFAFYISYIMEYVLLCNSGIRAESFGVKLAVKVVVYRALHPHVNGERLKVRKAKMGAARGNLFSNADDLHKFSDSHVIRGSCCYLVKIYSTRMHFFGGIEQISVSESGM